MGNCKRQGWLMGLGTSLGRLSPRGCPCVLGAAEPRERGRGMERVSHGVSSSLLAVQTGFAEASHQNPGHPLPPEPADRGRRLRHARPPRPATSRRHHPLPSPHPRTSAFPNAAGPRPHHAGPHRLRPLLEGPFAATGLRRGAMCPGRLLFWLVGNHSCRHQPRLFLHFKSAPAGARQLGRAPPCGPAAPCSRGSPALGRGARHTAAWCMGKGRCPCHQDHLVARDCLSLARWFLVHHPPGYQTGRRAASCSMGEGVSCGRSLPAQRERSCQLPAPTGRNDPSTSRNVAVPLSQRAGCACVCAGRGCLCPLHPTTRYVPPAKEPPRRRAVGTLTVSSLREQ